MLSTFPAFNLKVVLKETGIAADTLRAWERRYGLPMPQRTEGGHRLYSQRDIEIIKWLLKQQESGLSISRAVDRFNELLAAGTDPLAGARVTGGFALQPLSSESSSLAGLRDEWLNACLDYNEARAEQIFNHAFALHPVETVITQIIQRGLHEIGERWYIGKATVQQEHFSSGLATRRLEALIAASPPPTRKETILLACPPNEWHTLSLIMLHLFLRRRGFNAVYLGANVPISRFEETARILQAGLVVLVSHTLTGAASLQKTAAALTSKKMIVGYGGRIFSLQPEIARYMSGYHLGHDVSTAVDEIENILGGAVKKTRRSPASHEYSAAHEFFTSKRADIEQTIRTVAKMPKEQDEELQASVHFLGDNITAALQLGDMKYVSEEMNWIKLLLQAHRRPVGELITFMDTYAKAVNKHMNGSGKPILVWLKDEVQRLKAS
jgi:DNA-binding transcriptional MerR regulator